MRTKIFKRKDQPVDKFYGGSSWWSLTGKCVSWIKNNTNPKYYNFFKHGVCSDEVYFSTLVRYSPYSENILSRPVRYMVWNETGNTSGGPAVIKGKYIDEAINSEYPFARKVVDFDVCKEIASRIS